MATKISDLTSVSSLDGSELIEVVQSGANKKSPISKINERKTYSATDVVSGATITIERSGNTITLNAQVYPLDSSYASYKAIGVVPSEIRPNNGSVVAGIVRTANTGAHEGFCGMNVASNGSIYLCTGALTSSGYVANATATWII